MMQSPDLEVLKDIPGYKAILKAVLRSQIQLLVCISFDLVTFPFFSHSQKMLSALVCAMRGSRNFGQGGGGSWSI